MSGQDTSSSGKSIFISYSHRDESWKDRLVTHLRVFQLEGMIDLWDDRLIGAGEEWYPQIRAAIERADLAILLISADFLISAFIRKEEVPPLLQRQAGEGLIITPVLLKPCNWESVNWLEAKQIRPKDARPLASFGGYKRDEALKDIAREAVDAIQGVRRTRSGASLPPEQRAASPGERLTVPADAPRPAEYICYLASDRLASLFAQVDARTLADPRLQAQVGALLPLGEAAVAAQAEPRRRAAASQLLVVLDYLERTVRIGDLASIVRLRGNLDCDWYAVDTIFRADPWDPGTPSVYLTGQVEDYSLRLSCAKANFTGLQREGQVYIPTSVNRILFEGEAGLRLYGLVRLAALDRPGRVLRGTALYLVLSPELGSL